MTVKFDASKIQNGTLLLLGIGYDGSDQPGGDTRGRTNPKIYTYALLKAGGLWYTSGMGDTPQAAGWGAIERWMAKKGRVLVWVKGVHQDDLALLWTAAAGIEGARQIERVSPQSATVERRRGSEWRDKVRTPEDGTLGYHDL